jgi:hypothetical protein
MLAAIDQERRGFERDAAHLELPGGAPVFASSA